MSYKYSSKTLQKALSGDYQIGSGTGIAIKIFLLRRTGMGPKRLVPLKYGFNAVSEGIYQSDNIKVQKQSKSWKEKQIRGHFATSKIGSL
jgi:hypothetical protein